jgi:tetratricopeptide (TPR) repeat protein
MPERPTIFLSHTASDAEVAHAIRGALELLFGEESLTVSYSTRKDLEGSIQSGEDWFGWITQQVRDASVTLVVLTPASVQKPWILWETGAVYGAAASHEQADLRKVRPLTFGIKSAEVPGPLASMRLQITRGDDPDDVRQLLNDLVREMQPQLSTERFLSVAQRIGDAVGSWLTRTGEALRLAPLLPTEPVVQEWLSRLDELSQGGRTSEVEYLHQWMIVAFGREKDGSERPLDVRLHRRLGDLYAATLEHERAAEQYLLAHKLAPRDIYTLRFLGKAYLDTGRVEAAGQVVDDIDTLDPSAVVHNPQCAALKGRWLIAGGDPTAARSVYADSLKANQRSYYLADLLGQVLLTLGENDEAAHVYRDALRIIEKLDEPNIWAHSTAATAAIVSGDEEAAQRHLEAIRRFGPAQGEYASIERGLLIVQQQLGIDDQRFSSWRRWLRGEAVGAAAER